MVDEIDGGDMPPSSYLLMHPSAKLTEAEKLQLIQGITNSIK